MPKVSWSKAVEIIEPHILKIRTPDGFGTGFLCAYTENKEICAIATAAHVVEEAHLWEKPIRISHYTSGTTKLLRANERIIWFDPNLDTAVILFFPKDEKDRIPLPKVALPFISEKSHLKAGAELGWLGFPVVSSQNLCLFTGRNSCWIEKSRFYLIDGVAINGVSGGPAFYISKEGIKIIGSVSAYLPNRSGSTPGLAMITDVDQYLDVIKTIKNWEEAKKKETPPAELKEKQEEKKQEEKKTENT